MRTKKHRSIYYLPQLAAVVLPVILVACGTDTVSTPGTPVTPTPPTASLAGDATVLEGDTGTQTMTFTVQLSGTANGQVDITYATADGTATTADNDYTAASGTVSIPASATSATVDVTIAGDLTYESNETLTLTLNTVSANATLGTANSATGTINNNDFGGINDTVVNNCFSGTALIGACPVLGFTDQDAEHGNTFMSFTKVNAAGNDVLVGAANWSCARDNTTGLTWEVKQTSGLNGSAHTFTWFDSNAATNGGDAGTADPGTGNSCNTTGRCDTEKFIADVNAAGLCGFSDWRLPAADELRQLIDYASNLASAPALNTTFFDPSPITGQQYWSADTNSALPAEAWRVEAVDGNDQSIPKTNTFTARLVRP